LQCVKCYHIIITRARRMQISRQIFSVADVDLFRVCACVCARQAVAFDKGPGANSQDNRHGSRYTRECYDNNIISIYPLNALFGFVWRYSFGSDSDYFRNIQYYNTYDIVVIILKYVSPDERCCSLARHRQLQQFPIFVWFRIDNYTIGRSAHFIIDTK